MDNEKLIEINDEEFYHAVKVMRNKVGDKIYTTDGQGKIYSGEIIETGKEFLKAKIINSYNFANELDNFTLCIPNLKNPERLKFALEKSVELGFTNFITFNSERAISKSINLKRLDKIALAAMKQSLHSYFPKIKTAKSVKELLNNSCQIVLFDQASELFIEKKTFANKNKYLLIFGPEGSLSENELEILNAGLVLNLGSYRLRSETAIVKCASIISELIKDV